MRHNKNFNHLGRQAGHRKALMSNMGIVAHPAQAHRDDGGQSQGAASVHRAAGDQIQGGHHASASYGILVPQAEGGRDGAVPHDRSEDRRASGRLYPHPEDGLPSGRRRRHVHHRVRGFQRGLHAGRNAGRTGRRGEAKTRRSRKPAAKKADAVEDAKIVEAKPKKVAAKAGGATKAGAAKVAKKTNVGKKM